VSSFFYQLPHDLALQIMKFFFLTADNKFLFCHSADYGANYSTGCSKTQPAGKAFSPAVMANALFIATAIDPSNRGSLYGSG
jgi:hypothetical protein